MEGQFVFVIAKNLSIESHSKFCKSLNVSSTNHHNEICGGIVFRMTQVVDEYYQRINFV